MSWILSKDGKTASRTLENGWMESRLVEAIDADELAAAVPFVADPADTAAEVRARRDALLSACDWTQARDVTDALSAGWQPYRQALRDISTQAGFPAEIDWPVAP